MGHSGNVGAGHISSPITLIVTLAIGMLVTASAARAQNTPIDNRDYAIDLYTGTALGSVRIVGMGGAAVALAEGSVGMLSNPAGTAMRPATSPDPGTHDWDWDWHVDWLNPGLGTDVDNSGRINNEEFLVIPLLTAGVVVWYQRWALGLSVNSIRRQVAVADGFVEPEFLVGRLVLSRSHERFTWGVGLRTGSFTMSHIQVALIDGREERVTTELFELSGSALEAGVIWHPNDRDVRAGMTTALPVTGRTVATENCDPLDCQGYILPNEVHAPWEVSAGAAWRIGPTPWNRSVQGPWRDERHVLVAADVLVHGAVENGVSMVGFMDQVEQPSGRTTTMSVRAGVEYEWLPGRLRVRGGSYWEPGRIAGRSGRAHVTFGLDTRVWSFCFWQERYRLKLSLTADLAERYGNSGLSLGFWH